MQVENDVQTVLFCAGNSLVEIGKALITESAVGVLDYIVIEGNTHMIGSPRRDYFKVFFADEGVQVLLFVAAL